MIKQPNDENDSIENTDDTVDSANSAPTQRKMNMTRHSLGVVVLVSILAGFLGGFGSTVFLSSRPDLQQSLAGVNSGAGRKVILQEDSAIIDVVDKASPAVVSVVISKAVSRSQMNSPFFNLFGFQQPQTDTPSTPQVQKVGAGSGFFVTSDGIIMTNRHVVADENATYSVVTNDGKTYDAKVLARDPVDDMAFIKIDISNAPILKFADAGSIKIGEQVLAIGNSLGQYQNTVTSGIVSGIGRSIRAGDAEGTEQLEGVIQTDAAINPGNSGGPLLNLSGEVVGINTAIDQQGQLVGFAIPAADGQKALASYQKNGKISHPYLGVRYVMLDDQIAKERGVSRTSGALLVSGSSTSSTSSANAVIPGGPADKAGLKEGDIITQVNGHDINQTNSLAHELKNYSVGDKLRVTIERAGKSQDVSVTLEEAK